MPFLMLSQIDSTASLTWFIGLRTMSGIAFQMEETTDLIPFRTVFTTSFAAFHVVVITFLMSSCPVWIRFFSAAHTAVMIFLIPLRAESITENTALHVVVTTLLMLSRAFLIVATTAFQPDDTSLLICDIVASIAALAFAQTVFTVSNTCVMKPCTEVTTVDSAFWITLLIFSARPPAKLLTASPTTLVFALIPSASPCMKSGIQDSKSARGPSSGTEK